MASLLISVLFPEDPDASPGPGRADSGFLFHNLLKTSRLLVSVFNSLSLQRVCKSGATSYSFKSSKIEIQKFTMELFPLCLNKNFPKKKEKKKLIIVMAMKYANLHLFLTSIHKFSSKIHYYRILYILFLSLAISNTKIKIIEKNEKRNEKTLFYYLQQKFRLLQFFMTIRVMYRHRRRILSFCVTKIRLK